MHVHTIAVITEFFFYSLQLFWYWKNREVHQIPESTELIHAFFLTWIQSSVTAHLQKWVREKPRLRGFLNVFLEDTKNDVCENAAFSWWKILFVWKTTNYQKYVIYLPVLL